MKWGFGMKLRINNFTIGKQLRISYGLLMIFVIIMGILSYYQTEKMYENTATMYNNPLQVRRAVASLIDNVNKAEIYYRDLLIIQDEMGEYRERKRENLSYILIDGQIQIDILYDRYLGPKEDVDMLRYAFAEWEKSLSNKIDSYGRLEIVNNNDYSRFYLEEDQLRLKLEKKIYIIDDFAKNKADQLYISSTMLKKNMNITLGLFVFIVVGLGVLISTLVYKNIKSPIDELNSVAKNVEKGDLSIRSNITGKNELALFANIFNRMLDSIESRSILNKKSSSIATIMLSLDDAKEFFQMTLASLAEHVGAQTIGVYLLSTDKENYEIFESIGMLSNMRSSFKAKENEGEFGQALIQKKIVRTRHIDKDTKFIYPTSNGDFIPAEIITIPIIASGQTIAVLSISTILSFSDNSVDLINEILPIMSSRIESVLNYRRVLELKTSLEEKNGELEIQKSELKSQSVELNEQNRELELQKEQLSEVSQLKTNFLSNMSHELRTPLNAVIALSGILSRKLEGIIPDEEYGYLDVIGRSGQNLLRLINDILDISRIESGKVEVLYQEFNITDLLNEILELLYPISEQKNIEIRFEEKNENYIIESDIEKCRHILQNIIANAVKFTEDGFVSIHIQKNELYYQIKIIDTGIGIDDEHLDHIFDEFRQADGTTTRIFGGTGLGLAIAKKYANILGGFIEVKSTKNKGSEFILTLPILSNEEIKIGKNEMESSFINKASGTFNINSINEVNSININHRVLVIEDSESAIIQISDALKSMGCHISSAKDGNLGLEEIKKSVPDAIVLDLMMPDLDGFKFLEILRSSKLTEEIPVLVLTAKYISNDEHEILKKYNVHQLIQKGNTNFIDLKNSLISLLNSKNSKIEKGKYKAQVVKIGNKKSNLKLEKHMSYKKSLILIAEDNPDNMLTVRALLKDKFDLIEAIDGEQAVQMAITYKPDIILMDIALPIMDGVEAFKCIRKNPELKKIPVIALTASAMISDREIFLEHGFDAFIPKPIIEKQFIKILEEVLYGY